MINSLTLFAALSVKTNGLGVSVTAFMEQLLQIYLRIMVSARPSGQDANNK
jgi:hypothetical protein